MQQRENKNNNNSEPLGICQRLFNFVMDTLFRARGRLPNPPAPRSIEVPVEGSSSVFRLEPEYYRENSNSEIRVDFRHANGLDNRVAKNDKATGEKGSIRPVEIGIIGPTRVVSRGQDNGRELSQGKASEKVEGINGRGGEKEKNKSKDKNTLTEAAGGEGKEKPMIIDFLEGDINGRAEQFIKEKKIEFFRRSNTLDQPKSK
ncbi:hypothetical protein Vadar_027006 [Vaccinium darrowii]|uniref:Uncharacterized protein n=1 Tax=Vaccinium darrowii TaxID=229202 RepID=A0ACB7ZE76_9ERIC|nr:hypothetical protein Vadar_027006 [Vaccinium darrowii]